MLKNLKLSSLKYHGDLKGAKWWSLCDLNTGPIDYVGRGNDTELSGFNARISPKGKSPIICSIDSMENRSTLSWQRIQK